MDDKKPADPVSLEQALIDATARAKAYADREEERAIEADKRDKLQSQLEALPQHERRRVLDAIGLHDVSAAPRPIAPIKSSLSRRPNPFNTEVKGATDWGYWRNVATVEIWQALLLSLNIEPTGKGWLLDNAPGRTGDIPREYLDRNGLNDEFDRRWFLIKNRLETFYASFGQPAEAELTKFIRLPLFAAWAIEFEWGDLPPELVALVQEPIAPEIAAAPSEATEQGATSSDWIRTAQSIAAEIHKDKPLFSVFQIAEKTHNEMTRRKNAGESGMTGRGGRVPSADTIKRHALTGIKT